MTCPMSNGNSQGKTQNHDQSHAPKKVSRSLSLVKSQEMWFLEREKENQKHHLTYCLLFLFFITEDDA